jgi:hypothetical protein
VFAIKAPGPLVLLFLSIVMRLVSLFGFGSYYGILFWILNLLVYDELMQLVVDERELKI